MSSVRTSSVTEIRVHSATTKSHHLNLTMYGLVCGGFVEFPNECGIQEGELVVTSRAITSEGNINGGGAVAGFTKLIDAIVCVQWINTHDPRHEAYIFANPQLNIDYVPIV